MFMISAVGLTIAAIIKMTSMEYRRWRDAEKKWDRKGADLEWRAGRRVRPGPLWTRA